MRLDNWVTSQGKIFYSTEIGKNTSNIGVKMVERLRTFICFANWFTFTGKLKLHLNFKN